MPKFKKKKLKSESKSSLLRSSADSLSTIDVLSIQFWGFKSFWWQDRVMYCCCDILSVLIKVYSGNGKTERFVYDFL